MPQLVHASDRFGKLIEDRYGRLKFLAFSMFGRDGRFIGELTDPFPVRLKSGFLKSKSCLTTLNRLSAHIS